MVKFNSINRKIKKSFSLIELSICILISGLLTTLSVLCVDAVKQSRAQAIITQFETYRKAINNFYNDYGYLPGDLPNANYLLTPKEYSNSSTNDASIRRIQMNGSGKGYIFNCVNVDANNYFYSDSLGVWSNLSAGGYIKERLSNFCYTSAENQTTCIVGDFNMPYAKYCEDYDGVWNFITLSRTQTSHPHFLGSFYHSTSGFYNDAYNMSALEIVSFKQTSAQFFKSSTTSDYDCYSSRIGKDYFSTSRGGITNELLRIIDNKIDDGKPLTGSVLGHNSSQLSSYNIESEKCVNTPMSGAVSTSLSVDPSLATFDTSNSYTNIKNALCVGVFLMPELKS